MVRVRPAIVTVPERALPVLAATITLTLPLPLPAPGGATLSHGALDDAVHPHPLAAVTWTAMVPPAASMLCCSGAILNEHAADWVTVNGWPAMVIVPVREPPPDIGATLNPTDPLPLPVAPAVIESQSALLEAVHAQPAPAVTVTVEAPPADGKLWLDADSEYEQGGD